MSQATGPLLYATEEQFLDGEAEAPEVRREVITFLLGGESFAVELRALREIIKPPPLTEIPRAPRFLRGVLSLRGTMVPVLDLRRRLRLGAVEPAPKTRILIVEYSGEPVGLLVDEVTDVARIAERDIEAPPLGLGSSEANHIVGIGRYVVARQERVVVLLSVESVMRFEIDWNRPDRRGP